MVTREKYFTEKNIDFVSEEFLSVAGERSAPVSDLLDPLHSCLLIVDMQRYFLSEDSHAFIPSSEAIIP